MPTVKAHGREYEVIMMVDSRRSRRKARIVDALCTAAVAAGRTSGNAWPGIAADVGGTVANSYGFPAYTDAVLAVADPLAQIVYIWAAEISANKATLRGAAAATSPIPGVEDLYDNRTGALREAQARAALRTWVHEHRPVIFPRHPRQDHLISPEDVQVWTDGWLELGL